MNLFFWHTFIYFTFIINCLIMNCWVTNFTFLIFKWHFNFVFIICHLGIVMHWLMAYTVLQLGRQEIDYGNRKCTGRCWMKIQMQHCSDCFTASCMLRLRPSYSSWFSSSMLIGQMKALFRVKHISGSIIFKRCT